MDTRATVAAEPATFTRAGIVEGLRLALPALPVLFFFSAAFGVVAAQKGLTLIEAVLMSTLTFAGASQFVAADIWHEPMTLSGIAALAFVVGTVNLRFFLASASLRPWLGTLPVSQTYPSLALLTEPGWLIGTRYRSEGGADGGIMLGVGLVTWIAWILATIPGFAVGSLIADPRSFGIDLIMPCFFTAMLVPLWRGPKNAIPWVVSGVVALAASAVIPGWWFIIIGSVAGMISAGFIDD